MAEELKPHRYHPSILHMGDCSVCGNVASHPSHCTAGGPGGSAPSGPQSYRTGGGGGQTVIPATPGDAGPRPVGERVLLDQIDELKSTIRSLSADNEQLMNTIADMKIADDGTVEAERDALRQRVAELEGERGYTFCPHCSAEIYGVVVPPPPNEERRPGHSKLVYDKGKRTIVTVRDDEEFATECPACPYPTSLHDYHASPCDIAAMNARRAELEANLAAAHVRITSLEKNLDAWKSTAFNRYNEIEQQKARIAELEAACARKGNELCVQSQELAKLAELEAARNAKATVSINYQDTAFADEQTRSLGFEPRMLQWEWRNNPPLYGQETAGRAWQWVCEQAIIDALIHNGIPAWHGDAVSCVAQIVEAYAKSATDKVYARVNRWCSALRKCQTFTPSLMDGEEAKERLKEINRYVYSVLGTGDTK